MQEHKHEFIEAGELIYCECGASPYTGELAWAEKVQSLILVMRQRADETDSRAAGCNEVAAVALRDAARAMRDGATKIEREVLSAARNSLPAL